MTLDDLEAELARWTFLPGYSFRLRRNRPAVVDGIRLFDYETAVFEIHSRVPNTYDPTETVDVVAAYPVPLELLARQPDSFRSWLQTTVHHRMCHEADEWLKRDGEMIFDPHQKDR